MARTVPYTVFGHTTLAWQGRKGFYLELSFLLTVMLPALPPLVACYNTLYLECDSDNSILNPSLRGKSNQSPSVYLCAIISQISG